MLAVYSLSECRMAVPGPVNEVARVLQGNLNKRGLAIIVTNDYSDTPGIRKLTNAHKDGEKMKRTFEDLEIATIRKNNIDHDELVRTLHDVAHVQKFPKSYKTISVLFSGHGIDSGDIYMQDGKKISIQAIVNSLLPRQAPTLGNIPKLFFIDACRGSEDMRAVVCPRGGPRVASSPITRGKHMKDRGATEKDTVLIPPDGNTLLAYSTTYSHKAHENPDGGVWMKALAEKLRTSKQPIDVVLTEVRSDLHSRYQSAEWRSHMQMPETTSTLLHTVFLHPEAGNVQPPVVPAVYQCPGQITQRDHRHPAYYRGRLLHLEQTKIITDVTEESCKDEGTGFICHLSLVVLATQSKRKFQSSKVMLGKAEARESAAEVAVLSLDVGNTSPPQVARPPRNAAASNVGTKDAITRLKEYCDQKKLKNPIYTWTEHVGPQFGCRVNIDGRVFEGTVQGTKKKAKETAAQRAVVGLKIA